MNSPFIGQQAGNFDPLTHWPITWLIYLPCTTAQGQYHCASNIISNSHPFHSKWVDPPVPEIQQFQYFTLKIQGQGHGWGQSLKSQCKCSIPSTRIPFVSCQWALPFLRYSILKIWPWKSKVKVIPEGHIVGTTPYQLISLSFNVDEPSHSYQQLLKNLTLKIQGQGHGWGERWKSQHGSNILLTHIPFIPSQSPHSWDTAFSKFDLENPRSRSWLRWTLKVTTWVQHYIDLHPFRSMSIYHPIPEIRLF